MRFHKNVSAEMQEVLKEELKQYKKEMTLTKEELRELNKWVASGRSPYDNGDYIYTDYGCPMDFVSALRFMEELQEWFDSLSDEEREQELRDFRGDYDTQEESIVYHASDLDFKWNPDEELPFD